MTTTTKEIIYHDGRKYNIPTETCSPFGSYPNPWNLTDTDRSKYFSPLVKCNNDASSLVVMDLTTVPARQGRPQLATEEQREASARTPGTTFEFLPPDLARHCAARQADTTHHFIGRYDENRIAMYSSALFQNTDNRIQDFSGHRTLHVGMDVDGPVGTPVHAVCAGTVHAVGKNPALGDYGNVIVIKHVIPGSTNTDSNDDSNNNQRTIYALYGHLDDAVCREWKVGDAVPAGAMVGRMGALHENGGWLTPHVHFQLCQSPPATHDLPGVVAMADRQRALVEYPDPRYVLGPLY